MPFTGAAAALTVALRGAALRALRRDCSSARRSAAARLRALAAALRGAFTFLVAGLALRPGTREAACLAARSATAAFFFTRFAALAFFLALAITFSSISVR